MGIMSEMSASDRTRLRDLPNLGPASERMLEAAGIRTPAELDRVGSLEAYRRAIAAGGHPSLNFLWSIEAALLGLDWRDLPASRKEQLRAELEPSERDYQRLPERIARDDMGTSQQTEPPPDPSMGRNPDHEFLLRHSG